MCNPKILYGIIIAILVVIIMLFYMREGFEYNHLTTTYDGQNLLLLPPNPPTPDWFNPTSYNRAPESYSPAQSGIPIPPGAVKYTDRPGLSESYGVGYTDERGWIF